MTATLPPTVKRLDHPAVADPQPGVTRRSGRLRRRLAVVLPAAVLLLAVGLVWEVGVGVLQVPAYLLPPPSSVWRAFLALRPVLAGHVSATLTVATAGLVAAAAAGAALAVVITSVGLVRRVVYPFLVV